jgi:murein DD-endopeptidase MepM/ murein hydrolase activator NlpD
VRAADVRAADVAARVAAGEVVVSARSLRRLEWGARALLALVLVLLGVVAVTLPRSAAYGDLFRENLALKAELTAVDSRLSELDRLLLRIRLYDAEIRSIAEPDGDHGPITGELPARVFSGSRRRGVDLDGRFALTGGEVPMDEDVRPAEEWAASVSARLDGLLGRLSTAEPDLTGFVGELEELRALERALPSGWPADGVLTSGFGWRRSPFNRRWRFHSGVDIDGDRGEPIRAAADGRVITADTNAGYGRMVEIDHGFGITTLYAHCHALRVQAGEVVRRGQVIATVGNTGMSTGPHLHFEVRLEGHAVDPLDYLSPP